MGIGIGGEYPAGSVGCAESSSQMRKGTRNRWFILFTNSMIDYCFYPNQCQGIEDTLGASACRVWECWLFLHSFRGKDKLEKHLQTGKMRQLNANHHPTTPSQAQNVSVVTHAKTTIEAKGSNEQPSFPACTSLLEIVEAKSTMVNLSR
ncbi:hypothetical protein CEP53_004326 [Fusarium sp. AF-6]|nr:hypothetical protein CEP53_004326 [Fusarium sp. AF-6]